MVSANFTFDFDPNVDSKTKLTQAIKTAYLKNKKFFGKKVLAIKVIFLYTRSQMDQACGYKTQDWLVGFAKDKTLHILSPSVFDQVSSHPSSDFSYVLTHELAHIFSNELLGFYYPLWLYEGLAGYVAQQYKIRTIKTVDDFSKLHDSKGWNQHPNYPQAYLFTKYLIDTFGEKKILAFLKNLATKKGKHHYPKDFTNIFQQFFKTKFDQTVSRWLITT